MFCGCGGDEAPTSTQSVSDAGSRVCPANDGGTSPRILSNKSAELDGPTLGLGATPNDSLRQPIRIELLEPEPRFVAGPVFAMRHTLDDRAVEIAFSVTNVGATSACFIELVGFRVKDAAGATLTEAEMYNVFELDVDLWTDTCLSPGESGWLLTIQEFRGGANLFSSIAAIEFQYDVLTTSAPLPQARVIPDVYTVSGGIATVCFVNAGAGPAAITAQTFSQFVALDDAGDPLDWGFLTGRIQPIGLLQPGESGSASTKFPSSYQGTAHRMRPFIDFESPGPSAEPCSTNEPCLANAPGASRELEMVRRLGQRRVHTRDVLRRAGN